MEFIFSSVVVFTTSKGVNWRTDNMYSGAKEMDKRINNDLENITQKSKHRTTSTPLKRIFPSKKTTLCWKIFCHLRRDDEILHWQLDCDSKLNIVSLLCLSMTLCII
jgi:hypothetical protein